MSFWTDLETGIAAAVKSVEAELVKIAQFLGPIIQASAAEIGQAAVQAVMTQAPLVISGQEKFANAIASVQSAVTTTGKAASLTVISAATQQAYNALSQAAHPTPAP